MRGEEKEVGDTKTVVVAIPDPFSSLLQLLIIPQSIQKG
jgi:hypothetical protein